MTADPAPPGGRGLAQQLASHQSGLVGAILGFLACGLVAMPLAAGHGLVLGLVSGAGAAFGWRQGSRLDQARRSRSHGNGRQRDPDEF